MCRLTQQRKVSGARAIPMRLIATCLQPQPDIQQLWRLTSRSTRDEEPQQHAGYHLAAGAGRTVSLQHLSISGYLLGEVFKLPSNAQHWNTAKSRAGARCCRVATQPYERRFYFVVACTLLEKKRNRYYLVLVSRNWFSLVNLWKDKASHRRTGRRLNNLLG